ncbi:MAG: hypothetical protein AB1324_01135 [Candidatus Micrarchaeota archaeon]
MKTEERMKSVVLGLGLVGGGMFLFITPLNIAGLLIGLMLSGFGANPRAGEDNGVMVAPRKAAAPKKKKARKS